ncbi:thioredoxin family protein [Natrinema longum]|uniref:Thioredoxin family protein n=1 Tax=Natrinema longum TaxID=370324 RepID=A0A8A2U985_9EURY|nr:thioredoxin family protein [Natrinema longum]MBZ6493740.1 thioredoxin family protein [Natrinema longum]QSW84922.1 thioredoxin family protein [Natrinema longum]
MVLKESESQLEAGDPAPAFELEGVDGETYTLESFADDEALLVVFTCNHCPYAQAKFELLNELAAEYEDVSVVGINPNDAEEYPDDSFGKMREVVADGTIDYDAYLRDESQDVARAYGAVCTPDPFLFENSAALRAADSRAAEPRDSGEFRLVYHGRLDDAPNPDDEPSRYQIREAIDAVLAGEAVDLEWQPSRGCSIKWTDD